MVERCKECGCVGWHKMDCSVGRSRRRMPDPIPWCDWCHSSMVPIDAVETGMRRGIGLVWLCVRPDCGHEIERSVQFVWERMLLQHIWRTRLVRALWERAIYELIPETLSDDEWRAFYPSAS